MTKTGAILDTLYQTIAARQGGDAAKSYTASLMAGGMKACAQKLGEETVETIIAAMGQDSRALTHEAADLIYHLLVVLAQGGVPLDAVISELEKRQGVSGLEEKASRS